MAQLFVNQEDYDLIRNKLDMVERNIVPEQHLEYDGLLELGILQELLVERGYYVHDLRSYSNAVEVAFTNFTIVVDVVLYFDKGKSTVSIYVP